MRKTKLATYAVALTLAAAAMTGISTETAHAEESVQAVATDTDAAETTEAPAAEEITEAVAEDVAAEEVTVADGGNEYYNININGGNWDGTHYTVGGNVIINAFFCDGTYTYYLQADGTPMKNRLTYHPDGVHIIYFDAQGHEVFNNYANVTKTIEGNDTNDICYFDTFGYMYVNQLTYDETGTKIYFINACGVIEQSKWVKVDGAKYFDQDHYAYGYAYAQADGTLLTNTFTYWNGKQVYLLGDGLLATGLQEIGANHFYLFDLNDGHLIQTYSSKPGTYSLTRYYEDGYIVERYNGYDYAGEDNYDKAGVQTGHFEVNTVNNIEIHTGWSNMDGVKETYKYTYDATSGSDLTDEYERQIIENGQPVTYKYNTNYLYYNQKPGQHFYTKQASYRNGVLYSGYETYYNDDNDNCTFKSVYYDYNENGQLISKCEETYHEGYKGISSRTYTDYDAAGNVVWTSTTNYDINGNVID
ncbi:hypothetical protein KQI72_09865 [Eubacterium sp. MSJ-21]|nr:hypothetical protein [Eubacterium sp. MSJ-21]